MTQSSLFRIVATGHVLTPGIPLLRSWHLWFVHIIQVSAAHFAKTFSNQSRWYIAHSWVFFTLIPIFFLQIIHFWLVWYFWLDYYLSSLTRRWAPYRQELYLVPWGISCDYSSSILHIIIIPTIFIKWMDMPLEGNSALTIQNRSCVCCL